MGHAEGSGLARPGREQGSVSSGRIRTYSPHCTVISPRVYTREPEPFGEGDRCGSEGRSIFPGDPHGGPDSLGPLISCSLGCGTTLPLLFPPS